MYTKQSKYQLIEVLIPDILVNLSQIYETSFFGNLLVIDEDVMLTERDEMHYHEMIAHVPLNYLPKVQSPHFNLTQ